MKSFWIADSGFHETDSTKIFRWAKKQVCLSRICVDIFLINRNHNASHYTLLCAASLSLTISLLSLRLCAWSVEGLDKWWNGRSKWLEPGVAKGKKPATWERRGFYRLSHYCGCTHSQCHTLSFLFQRCSKDFPTTEGCDEEARIKKRQGTTLEKRTTRVRRRTSGTGPAKHVPVMQDWRGNLTSLSRKQSPWTSMTVCSPRIWNFVFPWENCPFSPRPPSSLSTTQHITHRLYHHSLWVMTQNPHHEQWTTT
jgi:hypothetical protein